MPDIRSLFETIQTLFWAVFGLIDLESFELDGIKIFTRFWGMLMFGVYSTINIVVLLNLLIAMMNHSYQLIFVSIFYGFFFNIIKKSVKYIFQVIFNLLRARLFVCTWDGGVCVQKANFTVQKLFACFLLHTVDRIF